MPKLRKKSIRMLIVWSAQTLARVHAALDAVHAKTKK